MLFARGKLALFYNKFQNGLPYSWIIPGEAYFDMSLLANYVYLQNYFFV